MLERQACRKELGLPADAQVVLMIARYVPSKSLDVALRAIQLVRESRPCARLLLIGEGNESPHYADVIAHLAAEPDINGAVRRLPFLSDIRRAFAAADVTLLCSVDEPLGRSILESMAMNVPVIVSDSGGNREIVTNGLNGLIVPPGDINATAAAILRLIDEPALRQRLIVAARAKVLTTFHPLLAARAVEEIYSTVLAKKAAIRTT
ncbi:MAG: glycosyltransferase [Acidobacteria bacterium]|nr:glycosyltransferase [Acidobacteriota bacterium]